MDIWAELQSVEHDIPPGSRVHAAHHYTAGPQALVFRWQHAGLLLAEEDCWTEGPDIGGYGGR